MNDVILAWLNANATNEAKAKEIEYQCEKFTIEFASWCFDRDLFKFQELLKQFKEERK